MDYKSFSQFITDVEVEENRLISRRKRIESQMNELNNKPPVIDHNGRYHSPFDGYRWIDEFTETEKKFLGGEYLPVDNFTTENKYHKEVTEKVTEKKDIPADICREMVALGYNEPGKKYRISRFEKNHIHKGTDNVEIVTCLIETDLWHFNKLEDYLYETRPILRRKINPHFSLYDRLRKPNNDTVPPVRNISDWIELKDDD
jgi:hypothetical protein